jgi:hypothetical protein
VAYGLGSRPLPVAEFPGDERSIPLAVALESDAPVDDIVVHLPGGRRVFIQSKRTASLSRRDKPLALAIAQFVRALRSPTLDPSRERLVLAVAQPSKSLQALFSALRRSKYPLGGAMTASEARALRMLDELTPNLTTAEREVLRNVANGLHFTEEHVAAAQSVLGSVILTSSDAFRAYQEIKTIARELAQSRFGLTIERWADRLAGTRLALRSDPSGPMAARAEARRRAVRHYRAGLVRAGRCLDLRSLGAPLPPIRQPLQEFWADTGVRPSEDRRTQSRLHVIARRRRRILLLGLPGSGKTTALRHVAALWALDSDDAALPFVISLRDTLKHLRDEHPLDAICRAALAGIGHDERPLLEAEFRERIGNGRIALLLDALDETRDRRFEVVQALDAVLRQISRDVTVVLATRDIGYAAASTLSFFAVRLAKRRTPADSLRRILNASAARHGVPADRAEAWCHARMAWIDTILDRDRSLAETPLGGILLALLAADWHGADLPRGRANTLRLVIESVVRRWELMHRQRPAELQLGALYGSPAAAALIESFALIGYLLTTRPVVKATEVRAEVALWLKSRWAQSGGEADVTAADIVGFWDEAGIFMPADESEVVNARLQLVAEIGAAAYVVGLPQGDMAIEMERLAESPGLVAVASLAAGMSQQASDVFVSLCLARDDLKWDLRAARHFRQNSLRADDLALHIGRSLLRHGRTAGPRERWEAAKAVALLPLPNESVVAILHGFKEVLTPDDFSLVSVICRTARRLPIENPLSILAAAGSALRPRRGLSPHRGLFLVDQDEAVADLIVHVADRYLPEHRELGDRIVEAAESASMDLARRLDQILNRGGRSDLVIRRHEKYLEMNERWRKGTEAWEIAWRSFLERVLALDKPRSLPFHCSWRLDELADFVETLRIGSSAGDSLSTAVRHRSDDLNRLITLTAKLGDFDVGLLSAEAATALTIDARTGDSMSLLFEGGRRRAMRHWSESNTQHDLEILVTLLDSTRWIARIAAAALEQCPHPETSDRIEAVIPTLRLGVNRLRAGETVIKLDSELRKRAARWQRSSDPFVRHLAAWCFARDQADKPLTENLASALSDPDRGVRETAIRGLRGRHVSPSVQRHLESLTSEAEATGYTCMHCGKQNDADAGSCVDCQIVGPRIKEELQKTMNWSAGPIDDEDEDDD